MKRIIWKTSFENYLSRICQAKFFSINFTNHLPNYFYKIKVEPRNQDFVLVVSILVWYVSNCRRACPVFLWQLKKSHQIRFSNRPWRHVSQKNIATNCPWFSEELLLANCLIYRYLLFILGKKTQIGIKRDLVKEDSKIFQKCTTFGQEDESLTRQVDYSRTQWQPFFNTVQDRRNWGGWGLSSPAQILADMLTLSNQILVGTDYAHIITTRPLGFLGLPTALLLSWLPPPDETKIIVREFPVNLSREDSYSLVGPHAQCTLHYSVAIDNWGETVSEIAFFSPVFSRELIWISG